MQARTIDEVLAIQQEIIHRAIRDQSPLGYFAALYHMFTEKVKEGIAQGAFLNGPRMEQLDVRFANHYFAAVSHYRVGGWVPSAWRYAFNASESSLPIVLQHLMLALNPHICYDRGGPEKSDSTISGFPA